MRISVCAVTHKMEREWPRTSHTIWTQTKTPEFLLAEENDSPSPCSMMNWIVRSFPGDIVVCLIDGARMLSPGILEKAEQAFRLWDDPFVYTMSAHLGADHQREHAANGYNQDAEDLLLSTVPWQENGYSLFQISTPVWHAGSETFWDGVSEATCFAMRRSTYLDLGGYDERFTSPGGGLCNLEFFKRAQAALQPVCLLGESTFHQFHGGVSANATESPRPAFNAEYEAIFGEPYRSLWRKPEYLGDIRPEAEWMFKGGKA